MFFSFQLLSLSSSDSSESDKREKREYEGQEEAIYYKDLHALVVTERRESKRNGNKRENKKIKKGGEGRKEQKGGSAEASKRRPFTVKTFMHQLLLTLLLDLGQS